MMQSSNLKAEAAPLAVPPLAAPLRAAASPSYRRLLVFLAPLVFTGLMMTFDNPVVNAMLTRLPNAQQALAALVVAFSLALVYEAPHVAMIEVATALATTRQALEVIRRFYGGLALVMGAAAGQCPGGAAAGAGAERRVEREVARL